MPIGSITPHDVKSWATGMRASGVGASTLQQVVHLFSDSLNAAIDAEVLQVNPAARIKLEKGAQEVERFLTRDEYAEVRAETPTGRDHLVLDLLALTGMRWSEVAGVHWSRVDMARGMVGVVETYDQVSVG